MRHGLTRRLVLYFSATLLVFSLVIGTVFSISFRRYTQTLATNDLRTHAQAIAASFSGGPPETAEAPEPSSPGKGSPRSGNRRNCRMHGGGMTDRHGHGRTESGTTDGGRPEASGPRTYCRRSLGTESTATGSPEGSEDLSTLLRQLNEFTGSEVWIVDQSSRTITLYGSTDETTYTELPPGADSLLISVFAGETAESQDFSPMLEMPSVTAGAPIRDAAGNVTGAILMHRRLSDIRAGEQEGLRILAGSLGLAFLLSAALALLLARRFIRPLSEMERTAASLAEGRYTARSGIRQDDEIGSLARSLDTLAEKLEEAAEQSARLDAMRRDFFASISHELRTPLTVLQGSLEVLSAGLVTEEEKRRSYLAQMETNVRHLTRLVGDIFDLARLENPDFSIEKTDMNLSDALHDAVRAARRLAAPKSVDIRCDEMPPIPMQGDYERIRQMFLTVLDNGVKFSPEGACVEVSATVTDGRWRVTVRDHGPGIDGETLPHIFDRFRTNRTGGTGLGLAIAQGIARRHDIVLEAENAEDGGAEFSFRGRASA